MRILNFLSRVAPVLVCLAAPDESSGGSSTQEPVAPAWAPPATEPVATGDTIEAKLTNAASHIKTFFTNLGLAFAAFTKLQGEYKTLETQFNSLKETAENEKTEHGKTKGLLNAEKTAHTETSGKLVKAAANVSRLETLCDLRGVDKSQAIPAADGSKGAEGDREQLVQNLSNAKDAASRGAAAEALRKFDAKQKAKRDAA